MDIKINLGCGNDKMQGYINVDNDTACKPDVVADLTHRLPFKDNCAIIIRAHNVLEHLPGLSPMNLLKEIYRVLRPGGIFIFRVPMAGTITAHRAIDHVSFFTPQSFLNRSWYGYNFQQEIKITIPFFHGLKFNWRWMYINMIFPVFTGIEGRLTKCQ